MRLTRIERNQIFQAIDQSTLDPSECVYEELADGDCVRHESGSTIDIKIWHTSLKARTFILIRKVPDGKAFPVINLASIKNAVIYVVEWANEAELVSSTPDFWAEKQRNRQLITDIQQNDSSNTPFTQDEQRQIAAQLQAIRSQVKEQFALTSEQMEMVEEKLDDAAEASARMGRKDWLLLFGGTVFTLIVSDMVTPAIAGHIFTMVVHSLLHMFIGGSEPPRPIV